MSLKKYTIKDMKITPPSEWSSERLKKFRNDLKLSQSVIANFLGLNVKTIEAYEKGSRKITKIACRCLDMIEKNPLEFIFTIAFIKKVRE